MKQINLNLFRRWFVTTQFAPNEARSVFPCYDEPDIKAVFALEILHGKIYHAISNMPIKEVQPS
jgi:aminopeptidase N